MTTLSPRPGILPPDQVDTVSQFPEATEIICALLRTGFEMRSKKRKSIFISDP
jgi:hypothetical protein